jgi:hypothetical protein
MVSPSGGGAEGAGRGQTADAAEHGAHPRRDVLHGPGGIGEGVAHELRRHLRRPDERLLECIAPAHLVQCLDRRQFADPDRQQVDAGNAEFSEGRLNLEAPQEILDGNGFGDAVQRALQQRRRRERQARHLRRRLVACRRLRERGKKGREGGSCGGEKQAFEGHRGDFTFHRSRTPHPGGRRSRFYAR